MTAAIAHSRLFMGRELIKLWRQPWYVAVTLVQPVVWLVLFGALFERVVDIPGFGSDNYIEFMTPGVLVMMAMFSAGWSGMGMINDLDAGVLDRMLVSPVRRTALIFGPVLQGATVIAIQSVIVVLLALAVGGAFPTGVGGVLVLIGIAVLLGAAFAAFSNGVALYARKEESLIGLVQFVVMPLTFLSSGFMPANLMPDWMQTVADFNPLNWGIEAGRSVVIDPDWGLILSRVGLLAALTAAGAWFATRAFRAYQRSV
jgi:ABC-2 type transport system permease protein